MTTILNSLINDPFFSELFSSEFRLLKNNPRPSDNDFELAFMDNSSTPRVNIYYTKDKYVIEAACSGYNKEDIEIEIKDDSVILSYRKTQEEPKDDDKTYIIKQISTSSFQKRIKIPNSIEKPSEAKFINGKIVIEFPFRESSKPTKIKLIS